MEELETYFEGFEQPITVITQSDNSPPSLER